MAVSPPLSQFGWKSLRVTNSYTFETLAAAAMSRLYIKKERERTVRHVRSAQVFSETALTKWELEEQTAFAVIHELNAHIYVHKPPVWPT